MALDIGAAGGRRVRQLPRRADRSALRRVGAVGLHLPLRHPGEQGGPPLHGRGARHGGRALRARDAPHLRAAGRHRLGGARRARTPASRTTAWASAPTSRRSRRPRCRSWRRRWGCRPTPCRRRSRSTTRRACRGEFRPLELDGLATRGLAPPKSNWAVPLDEPPFHAYPIMSANVFTFGGLQVDAGARVLDRDGAPIPGLYAAGEIIGTVLRHLHRRDVGAEGHGVRAHRGAGRRAASERLIARWPCRGAMAAGTWSWSARASPGTAPRSKPRAGVRGSCCWRAKPRRAAAAASAPASSPSPARRCNAPPRVEDGPDRLFDDLRAVGGGASDPALLRAYAEGQLALHDWLAGLGVRFTALEQGGGQSVARAHRTDPVALMTCLARAVEGHPHVVQRLSTRAARLLRRDGAVAGMETTAERGVRGRRGGAGDRRLFPRRGLAGPLRAGPGAGDPGRRRGQSRGRAPHGAAARRRAARHGPHQGNFRRPSGQRRRALRSAAGLLSRRRHRQPRRPALRGRGDLLQTDRRGVLAAARRHRLPESSIRASWSASEPGVPLFDFAAALAAGRLVRADTPAALAHACGIDHAAWRRRSPPTTPPSRRAPARRAERGCATAPACRRPWTARPSTPSRPGRPCSQPIAASPPGRTALCSTRRGGRSPASTPPARATGGFHGEAYMTGSALGKAAFFGRAAGAAGRAAPSDTRPTGRTTAKGGWRA